MTPTAVEVAHCAPRSTAVMRETTSWPNLGATIMTLLDRVWALMRTPPFDALLAHDEFGENVILYLDSAPTIEVARAIHHGPYDALSASIVPG